MIFGNPERFAIELEFLDQSGGLWMNGRSCYWISGERVGDFEVIDSLRDGLFCWEKMSYYRDRSNKDISHLDTQELVTALYSGLYNTGLPNQDSDNQRATDGQWDRHNINPGTIVFKDWIIFLVTDETAARCLYARSADPLCTAKEQALSLGEFDRVLDETVTYLLNEYEGLGGT